MSNPLMWIVVIFGGGFSILLCAYLILSMIGMIIYKIYRKVKYHVSLYD